MRTVSLLPGATEILFELGCAPIGVTHECDYPERARTIPSVRTTHVDADADSETIAEQVSEGDGLYALDRERLRALDPELIVTQGVCEVCAIEPAVVHETVDELGLDSAVLQVDVHGLADLRAAITRVSEAIGGEAEAAMLVEELDERVSACEANACAARASSAAGAPSVVVLDWLDPVMVAGHWVPEMVERLGGEYAMESMGAQSRYREWEEVLAYDPDVVVAAPCGFDLRQATENRHGVTERPGWDDLAAVRNDRAYVMDGDAYLNRPGPRLVDTMEYLAWAMYPDEFEQPPRDAIRSISSGIEPQ